MSKKEAIQKEVDANYKYFKENLEEIKLKYPNKKYCLLKNKEVISCFNDFEDAYQTAHMLYNDGLFSIQEINPIELSLGYCH